MKMEEKIEKAQAVLELAGCARMSRKDILATIKKKEGELIAHPIEGGFSNALTSLMNKSHPVGGWSCSISVEFNEIFCYQHPDAGSKEFSLELR